MGSIWLKSDW